MIKSVSIKNYRSIKELEIPLSQLTAFIGYNNSGKSNILNALDVLLGERWPTDPFDKEDFHNHNTSNPIEIEAFFQEPLVSHGGCHGFKLKYDGHNRREYYPIDEYGDRCQYGGYNITGSMKEEAFLLYIGLDRKTEYQLRASKWTMYGKLLRKLEDVIASQQRSTFKIDVDSTYNVNILPSIKTYLEKINEYTKIQTGLELEFDLKPIDPLYVLKNIRPYIKETANRVTDVDNVGAGIQSAITIALARTYADVVKTPITIVIEEPELYLHPHACRHFYKLLKQLSGGNLQIIYATHERCFVNIEDFQNIRIVEKENNETKVRFVQSLAATPNEEIKIISKCEEWINEMFFAKSVIIVEGFADRLACKLGLEKEGVDIDKENISIVNAGGSGNIFFFSDLAFKFGKNTIAVFDEDAVGEINRVKSILGHDYVFEQSPYDLEGMLGLSGIHFDRVSAIQQLPNWFNTNPNPVIYPMIKTKIM